MRRTLLHVACAAAFAGPLLAQTAVYSDYGQGCPAAGGIKVTPDRWDPAKAAWVATLPRMGELFGATAPSAANDVFALLLLGGSDSRWMGLPLPLTVYWRQKIYPVTHMPEFGPCLLAAPQVAVPAALNTGGGKDPRWALEFPVPRDPALMGVALYIQWAVFYQSWLNPQPPWPGILMEEGFRWSSGGKAVVGVL